MTTIEELRQQYPQYDDMSDYDVADAFYKKHYSDMDRADFDYELDIVDGSWFHALSPNERRQLSQQEAVAQGSKRARLRQAEARGRAQAGNVGKDRVSAFGQGVQEGATFGFIDEAIGGLVGLSSRLQGGSVPEEEAARARAAVRTATETARSENPYSAGAGELVGGLSTMAVPAAGVGRAAQGGSRLGNFARGVTGASATGAAYGGLYGAGSGTQGNRAQTAADYAKTGAAAGGAFRAALPAITRAGGALVRGAQNRVAPAPQRAEQMALKRFQRAGFDAEGLRKANNRQADRGGINAEFLFEVPQNQQSGGWSQPAGLARALSNIDGASTADAQRALAERLVGTPAQRARNFVVGTNARIMKQLERQLPKGVKPSDYSSAFKAVFKAMADEARPRYAAAYPKRVHVDALNSLWSRGPEFAREILPKAAKMARLRNNSTAVNELRAMVAGQPTREISIATVDMIKQTLDDAIDSALRNGNKAEARALRSILKGSSPRQAGQRFSGQGFLDVVDRLVPEYASARDAWATGARMQDAMKAGTKIFGEQADDVLELVSSFNQPERDTFLLGVSRAIATKLLKSDKPTRALNQMRASPNMRAILSEALPPSKTGAKRSYQAFMARLEREAMMIENSNKILAGSRTTPLAEEIRSAGQGEGLLGLFSDEVGRNEGLSGMYRQTRSALDRYAFRLLDRLFARPGIYDDATNKELYKILFSRVGSKDAKAVIERLTAQEGAQQAGARTVANLSNSAGQLGAPAGIFAAQQQERNRN